jgi:hypothetical protein
MCQEHIMKIRSLLSACVFSALGAAVLAGAQTPATPSATPAAPAAQGAAVPPAAPAIVYKEGVIKVGTEMKQTLGTMADVDKGDNGCYLTLKDEKGAEFIEIGKFEICTQKPPLKGKRVALAYSLETIQATSCYGDPKCKKTETVPLVVGVKIVE